MIGGGSEGQSGSAGQLLVDLVREVVAAVRPEELGQMELVALAFAEDPRAALAVRVRSALPALSDLRTAAGPFTSIALGVATDVCAAALTRRLHRRPEVALHSVVPPIGEWRVARLHALAVRAGRKRGLPGPVASTLATTMLELWTREPARR